MCRENFCTNLPPLSKKKVNEHLARVDWTTKKNRIPYTQYDKLRKLCAWRLLAHHNSFEQEGNELKP